MFNLSEQVRRLPATLGSRYYIFNLTEREMLVLKHIISLKIQQLKGTTGAIEEVKRLLEKINVQSE